VREIESQGEPDVVESVEEPPQQGETNVVEISQEQLDREIGDSQHEHMGTGVCSEYFLPFLIVFFFSYIPKINEMLRSNAASKTNK